MLAALLRAPALIRNPSIDYHAIAPELVVAGTIFLLIVVDLFLPRDRKHLAMPVAFAGVAAALGTTLTLIGQTRSTFGGTYVVDNFAVLLKTFFLATALVVLLLSYRYIRE